MTVAIATQAYEASQIPELYRISLACAESGNSDAAFAVGLLLLSDQVDTLGGFSTQAERDRNGVDWLRRAALRGHEQAIRLIADAYSHGRYGLPRDEQRATCMQAAVERPERVTVCLEEEPTPEL